MKLNIEQLASEANAYFGLYNEFWISQISIESIFNKCKIFCLLEE